MALHVVRYLIFPVRRQDSKSVSPGLWRLVVELVIDLVLSGGERLRGLRLDLVQQISRHIVITINMLALFAYRFIAKGLYLYVILIEPIILLNHGLFARPGVLLLLGQLP